MTLLVPLPIQQTGVKAPASQFFGLLDDALSAGISQATDLQVIQNPSGADVSVTVQAGAVYVAMTNGGKRRVVNDANSNSGRPGTPNVVDWLTTFTTPHATLPRIDRVVVMMRDANTGDGSGAYDTKYKVIPGTATSGATLVNLTGAAAVPANCLLLANVLVAAATSTIVTAQIDTTVRTRAILGAGKVIGSKATTSALSGGPPASPSDGDIWVATGVDANGTRWQFSYNAGSASANKWEYIGGSPLVVVDATSRAVTIAAAWTDIPGGVVTLTLARAGDYDCRVMSKTQNTGASAAEMDVGLNINAVDPAAHDYVAQYSGATGGMVAGEWEYFSRAVSAGGVVKARYMSQLAGTIGYTKLAITPHRIS